jgi:hypothetical protein
MAADNALFKLVSLEQDVSRPGDLLVEIGTQAFTTTGVTVEVTTQLTEILYALLTIDNSVVDSANDRLRTDKVITSGAVTVQRATSGTSGAQFTFMFIGRKVA